MKVVVTIISRENFPRNAAIAPKLSKHYTSLFCISFGFRIEALVNSKFKGLASHLYMLGNNKISAKKKMNKEF